MTVDQDLGGRRVRAECDQSQAQRARHVFDAFAELARDGRPMEPGLQIRFGWSLLRLVEDGDGLRVAEPDFALWPQERWVNTIDVTLQVLVAQISLLHRLGVEGQDAYFDQKLVLARGALESSEIFLRRTSAGSEDDSGWLLGSLDDPEALSRDDIEARYVANLVAERPVVLQALALPAGFIAIFSGDALVQVLDPANQELL